MLSVAIAPVMFGVVLLVVTMMNVLALIIVILASLILYTMLKYKYFTDIDFTYNVKYKCNDTVLILLITLKTVLLHLYFIYLLLLVKSFICNISHK